MDEPTMETLARRLDRVERENRRLKRAGVMAVAVMAALVLMGHATSNNVVKAEVVEADLVLANAIGIRDKTGMPRGGLDTDDSGAVRLVFLDRQGTQRLQLSVNPDGEAGIGLLYKLGNPGAFLIADSDGSRLGLALRDKYGKIRAAITLGKGYRL